MQTPSLSDDQRAAKIAHHMLSQEGTGPAWDINIVEARVGYTKLTMTLREDMLNGHQTAHGGMIFALADTAFAYACNSRNRKTVAQHASISFISPAYINEQLTAEAVEKTMTGRSGVYDVTVFGADERIVAIFQGLSRTIDGTIF